MDTLSIIFEYIENINYCTITVNIEGGVDYPVVDGEVIHYAVNSNNEINLSFTISDICFSVD